MNDLATGVLRSQGENYLQKGQAYVQSKMGWLSGGELRYLFDIDNAYGAPSPYLQSHLPKHAMSIAPVF